MLVHLPSLVEGKDGFLSHSESYFTGVALDYPIDLKVAEPKRGLAFLSQLWPDDQESIQTLRSGLATACYLILASRRSSLSWVPSEAGKAQSHEC